METTYTIGLDGYRSSKTTGDTTVYYKLDENGQVIEEVTETGTGDDKTTSVTTILRDGNRALRGEGYYVYNAHGDVVAEIGPNGKIYEEYTYDDWGMPTGDCGSGIRYAGEYYDSEIGQIYLRARYYQPGVRRFTQEDPARDELNWYSYCDDNPVNAIDPSGLKDYIYTSKTEYYIENDWGRGEFLHPDRYFVEIDGHRYVANSKETPTLYDWDSVDKNFLNKTLNSLVKKANKKKTNVKRIVNESVGGELDFKLQMKENTLYLANGVLYNRNEAGNFVWAYFLESHNVSGYLSGVLAQGGSIVSPLVNMKGLPRLDEEWDRRARWAGVKYYYDRNSKWWVYYIIYGRGVHL